MSSSGDSVIQWTVAAAGQAGDAVSVPYPSPSALLLWCWGEWEEKEINVWNYWLISLLRNVQLENWGCDFSRNYDGRMKSLCYLIRFELISRKKQENCNRTYPLRIFKCNYKVNLSFLKGAEETNIRNVIDFAIKKRQEVAGDVNKIVKAHFMFR